MIQLDSRSRTKNPTPSVVRNPNPTPPKDLRLLTTPAPTPQPCFELVSTSSTGVWNGSMTIETGLFEAIHLRPVHSRPVRSKPHSFEATFI